MDQRLTLTLTPTLTLTLTNPHPHPHPHPYPYPNPNPNQVVWTNEEKHGRNSEEPMMVLTQPPQSKLAGRQTNR